MHRAMESSSRAPGKSGCFCLLKDLTFAHDRLEHLFYCRTQPRVGQWCLGVSWHPRSGLALFENLKDGVTVNEFVELFPGLNLVHARSVLEHAAKSAMIVH